MRNYTTYQTTQKPQGGKTSNGLGMLYNETNI
jgi:hypothetical protein